MNAKLDNGGVIYLITNTVNDKRYVGLTTKDENVRFKEHVYDSHKTKCKYAIHQAMRKHNSENFTITAIERCLTNDELRNAEIRFIAELGTHISLGKGYNMTLGGEGVLGYEFTVEHRNKMSAAHKGIKFTESHKQNISKSKMGQLNPMFGKRLTNNHKRKIGESNTGKIFSIERCKKISRALIGKKQTWKQPSCKKIDQFNIESRTYITTFDSIQAAARSISDNASASNILYTCTGKRKFAYGFYWQFST